MKRSIALKEKYGIFVLGLILAATIAIRFAAPVKDGDLFWHLKYGEYMLENRTLIPDHSIYSWTPADNNIIYCTWAADILLCLMNRAGGLPCLFAFRYLCVLLQLITVWLYARQMGRGRDPATIFILLVVALSSYGASFLKPEIMSMVLMTFLAGLYLSVKASMWGRLGTKPFLFFPLLFLLWVNTHGVFFTGLILLGLILLGEGLNYLSKGRCAFSGQGMIHLITGAFLSLVASLVNPYGYKPHLTILGNHFSGNPHMGVENIAAFKTIFNPIFHHMHYIDFWVIMIVSFVALFSFLLWKKRECDWGILLPSIFLAFIYARFARATFYWPAFWAMTIIYLRGRIGPLPQFAPRAGLFYKGVLILLFLSLSVRAVFDSAFSPFLNQWPGFGTGYANPVQASAFIKKHRPGNTLYNSYGIGGYLIYDLYPLYRVFCDSRYFPYIKWYPEYYEFYNGGTPLNEFEKKYPFDVAIIDYHFSKISMNKFLTSREWTPVFYGPAAVVFVKKDMGADYSLRKLSKDRFNGLRSLHQAFTVFIAAQNLGDLETSGYILGLIKNRFSFTPGHDNIVRVCDRYQNGLTAMDEGDYETAFAQLNPLGMYPYRLKANSVIIRLRNWKVKQFVRKGEYRKALNLIEATLQVIPGHISGLFNAGIIGYMINNPEKHKRQTNNMELLYSSGKLIEKNGANWKDYLKRFLNLAPNHPKAAIAREVLEVRGLPGLNGSQLISDNSEKSTD